MNSAEQLIVFVKAPRPGSVKTRMAKTMGADEACAAYRDLVTRVLDVAGKSGTVELRFAPDDARAEITPWLRDGWTAEPQGDSDLGARMHRAFTEAFARDIERVVIIGSDCVELQTKDIRSAFRELKSFDVVVGPATDGGYWLIGLRAAQAELFRDITWSSEQVLGQTLQHAKSLGLRIQLLRILSDVDTEEDWRRTCSAS
ncbi:MAG TPA: TIGR04282 family arsenosugar biosynthesis glycosyltransferase [Candidatus Acidoferrum sp.]|nr:TIGR04282 family arsenosugar biosynthesis glycosyltransferase [Candidatus Acidoferrum sp.]